jgi:hypothetical protein
MMHNVNQEPLKKGKPTPEELTMIRDYVLLPPLLTMMQRSIDEVENSSGVLKRLYQAAGQVLMNRVSQDLRELKGGLAKCGIKVSEGGQEGIMVYFNYVCRGYQDRFGIVREVMKAEISLRLTEYLRELTSMIQAYEEGRHDRSHVKQP